MNADLLRLPTPVVERLLGWCAETSLLAAALVVVALLADRWRRPHLGPASRHVLWVVVLVKLMMPPLVSWPWSRPWITPVPVSRPAEPRLILQPSLAESMETTDEAIDVEPCEVAAVEADDSGTLAESSLPHERHRDPLAELSRFAVGAWILGSLAFAARQAWRIGRFHRRTRRVADTPGWLIDEAARIASGLSVRLPEIRAVAGLQSPLLWCLGRPVLLVPEGLIESLGIERWRCVLAHELAHIRRCDHWVSRLELAAGIVWWWNPLYWWACHRINAEAELACDAWVVATLPRDRLTYAESLVRICTKRSLARMPAPSVGVAGSGRYFERRLTMILKDRVSNRLSAPTILAALLLLVLAVPSWTIAKSVPAIPKTEAEPAHATSIGFEASTTGDDSPDNSTPVDAFIGAKLGRIDLKPSPRAALATFIRRAALDLTGMPPTEDFVRSIVLDDDDEADDDKEKEKAEQKEKAEKKQKAEKKAKSAKKPAKATRVEVKTSDAETEAAIEKAVKAALGPDFEKKMEALGEEMGKKFGPGSDFEKKMKEIGGEMEKKFGPGSDFEKQMKTMGGEMEKKFGPGSDFEKQMKTMGKDMEKAFGAGSEFQKEMSKAAKAAKDGEKKYGDQIKKEMDEVKETQAKIRAERAEARAKERAEAREKPKSKAKVDTRERRVKAIEAQIRQLTEELKKIKAEDGDEDEDEDKAEDGE